MLVKRVTSRLTVVAKVADFEWYRYSCLAVFETTEARQASWAASSLLFREPEFGTTTNGTYPSADFPRLFVWRALLSSLPPPFSS